MGRTVLVAAALLAAAALGTAPRTAPLFHRVARHIGLEGAPRALHPGDPLRSFQVASLDGSTTTFSAGPGAVRVINVFATWCSQCRIEIPELSRLAPTLNRKDVQLVGIDQEEESQQVERFASEIGMNYPVFIDTDGITHQLFGARFIPTTIVVDRQGIIRFVRMGALSQTDIRTLIADARS